MNGTRGAEESESGIPKPNSEIATRIRERNASILRLRAEIVGPHKSLDAIELQCQAARGKELPMMSSRSRPPKKTEGLSHAMQGFKGTNTAARIAAALRPLCASSHRVSTPVALGAVAAAAARSTLAVQFRRESMLVPHTQLRGFSSPAEPEFDQLSDAVQRMLSLDNASQVPSLLAAS